MQTPSNSRREPRLGKFLSAKYLWIRAVAFATLFLVAHLAGLREYTTFLSGTTDSAGASMETAAFWGTVYLVLYMGMVLAVPILLLAAALLWTMQRFTGKAAPKAQA